MQHDLFNAPPESGAQLRDMGIKKAEESADRIKKDWNETAFILFRVFMMENPGEFLCEDFRKWATDKKELSTPPTNRVFGGIIVRAKKAGMIEQVRFQAVTNPRAHKAICAVWKRIE